MSVLFANLLLAHFLSDFPLQWDRMVADKRQRLLRGYGLYVHGLIVAGISWLAIGYWSYWWLAALVAVSHFLMGSLEAAGLTIAAKSILRFNDDDGPRTEYVLAGTLLSLLIALASAAVLYCFVLDVDVIGIIKAGVANARS